MPAITRANPVQHSPRNKQQGGAQRKRPSSKSPGSGKSKNTKTTDPEKEKAEAEKRKKDLAEAAKRDAAARKEAAKKRAAEEAEFERRVEEAVQRRLAEAEELRASQEGPFPSSDTEDEAGDTTVVERRQGPSQRVSTVVFAGYEAERPGMSIATGMGEAGEGVVISDEVLAQANAMLDSLGLEGVSGMLEVEISDMQYQGFEPRMFNAYLWSLAIKQGITQADHLASIKSMACLYLIRGNKLQKLRSSGRPSLVTAVERWIRTYKLVDVKPSGPYTVTLARVAASQAMMLSKSLHLRKAGVVGTIKPEFVAEGFPPAMATSNFGVLIPVDIQPESFTLMRKAFYYHQYLFDRTINSGTKKYSSKDDIVKYADIQINSEMYTCQQRFAHCKDVGILETTGSGNGLTVAAAAALWDAAP